MAKPSSNNKNQKSAPVAATPVRNTTIPRPQTPSAVKPIKQITYEMIAKRAYEISQSPQCGSEFDNWVRAERELKAR